MVKNKVKKNWWVLIAPLGIFCALFACQGAPSAARPGAVTEEIGRVRVQILSSTLARIELKGPKGYENRPSYHIVNRLNWPGASAQRVRDAGETKIITANYTVVVPDGGRSLSGVYMTDAAGTKIWEYTELPSANVYLPAPGETPAAWAIADNPRVIPAEWGYRLMPENAARFADYNGWDTVNNAPDMFVFVPQGDAKQLRKDFTCLTGESEFIPVKALGLWHSRYHAYSEESALAWIDTYRAEQFPLDYFVVDTDWRASASTGYSVNTKLFPDMPRFIQQAHDKHVGIMFNDHPRPVDRLHSLAKDELVYRTASLRSILDMGLDTWWYDRNWNVSLVSPIKGVPKESFGMYLYQKITGDYREETKPAGGYARRPLIMGNVDGIDNGVFKRAPNLASHRFSMQWTGDTHGQPDDLRQEIVNLVRSGALTSTPYISSDIAGHMDILLPEQWVRWTQFAALSPVIRYHSTVGDNLDRSPWLYGDEAEDIARDYINMRYRLLPLLYSLARENYETGLPLARRLDYTYPAYTEAQDNTQYTLGGDILAAPIWEAPSFVTAVPADWLSSGGNAGLSAEFFNNPTLSGDPVLTRVDSDVNFNWGAEAPGEAVPRDNFSARWSGDITVGNSDAQIAVTCDDGVRLYIDGELVIDSWQPNDSILYRSNGGLLKAGSTHAMVIEYYEAGGAAVLRLQFLQTRSEGNTRQVFIPDGTWIDVWTGAEYSGPQTLTVTHNKETSPIFVRSGSILPLAEQVAYIGERPWNVIGLDVYPSTTFEGTSVLYEDDGDTVAYKDGQFRKTHLKTSFDSGSLSIAIGAAQGSYAGAAPDRTWKIRVHAPESWGALLEATMNGAAVTPVTLAKDPNAAPFAISGGARDALVYEFTVSGNVSAAQELRLTFRSL
jgi:alpha-glucosidase (family GH31 glycosyl hydrolase)